MTSCMKILGLVVLVLRLPHAEAEVGNMSSKLPAVLEDDVTAL